MKETQPHNRDEVKVVSIAPVQKKREHLGRIIPHPGHTLYEFNKGTYEIKKAEFSSSNVDFKEASKGSIQVNRTVIVKENCFYISSLNVKNAVKKIHKMFNVPCVIELGDEC